MNAADTFFYTWLEQLGKIASINENIDEIESRPEPTDDDFDNEVKTTPEDTERLKQGLQAELKKIKEAADYNKRELTKLVEDSENKEIIINPKESSAGGLTPHAYRLYLDKGELEYLTLN